MNPSTPILFVGDTKRQEFAAAADWLRDRGACLAADIPSALKDLTESEFSPGVIILAELGHQPAGGRRMETLRRVAPLARIVHLLGPWLEGESRSGRPLAGSLRWSWEQWPLRTQPIGQNTFEASATTSLLPQPWLLPVTASPDDRLLAALDGEAVGAIASNRNAALDVSPSRLIAVRAQNRETAQSLCDICSANHWKSIWLRTLPAETPLSVDAVLFDLAAGTPNEIQSLTATKSLVGAAPLVAILGFPRPEDIARLKRAGAAAVISKPFMSTDLIWQIEQLLRRLDLCADV